MCRVAWYMCTTIQSNCRLFKSCSLIGSQCLQYTYSYGTCNLWQSVSHDSDGGRRVPSSLILSLMLNLRLLSTVRGRQQLWSPWQPQKQHYHRGPQVTTNYTPRRIIPSRTRSSNRVLAWISAVLHVCVVLSPFSLPSFLTPPHSPFFIPPHTQLTPSIH